MFDKSQVALEIVYLAGIDSELIKIRGTCLRCS